MQDNMKNSDATNKQHIHVPKQIIKAMLKLTNRVHAWWLRIEILIWTNN